MQENSTMIAPEPKYLTIAQLFNRMASFLSSVNRLKNVQDHAILQLVMSVKSIAGMLYLVAIFISLLCMVSHSAWMPLAYASKADDCKSGSIAAEGSSQEMMEVMLRSLALYILASEMLSYLEDGAGGTDTLAQKYSSHPGWIPAFGRAIFDEEGHVLYVPLGQCMWK